MVSIKPISLLCDKRIQHINTNQNDFSDTGHALYSQKLIETVYAYFCCFTAHCNCITRSHTHTHTPQHELMQHNLFIMLSYCFNTHDSNCAITKVVNRRLPTAATLRSITRRSCGVCGQCDTVACFSEYFGFPYQLFFHQLLHIH